MGGDDGSLAQTGSPAPSLTSGFAEHAERNQHGGDALEDLSGCQLATWVRIDSSEGSSGVLLQFLWRTDDPQSVAPVDLLAPTQATSAREAVRLIKSGDRVYL